MEEKLERQKNAEADVSGRLQSGRKNGLSGNWGKELAALAKKGHRLVCHSLRLKGRIYTQATAEKATQGLLAIYLVVLETMQRNDCMSTIVWDYKIKESRKWNNRARIDGGV